MKSRLLIDVKHQQYQIKHKSALNTHKNMGQPGHSTFPAQLTLGQRLLPLESTPSGLRSQFTALARLNQDSAADMPNNSIEDMSTHFTRRSRSVIRNSFRTSKMLTPAKSIKRDPFQEHEKSVVMIQTGQAGRWKPEKK